MSQETVRDYIDERTSPVIEFVVEDENGVGPALDTLTLTLYDLATGTKINGRDKQNVLNVNGVTVTTAGSPAVTTIKWPMAMADNAMIGSGADELHIALFEWTWASGARGWHLLIVIPVRNRQFVP